VFRALIQEASIGDRITLLRRALDLWRGPLLADIASDRLRERVGGELIGLRLTAMERLAEAEPDDLIGELTQWCAEYPRHERLAGHLMLAQYRAGRQAEALTTYRRLRDRLDEELRVEPGRDLHDRYVAILRRDPALSPSSPAWRCGSSRNAWPETRRLRCPTSLPSWPTRPGGSTRWAQGGATIRGRAVLPRQLRLLLSLQELWRPPGQSLSGDTPNFSAMSHTTKECHTGTWNDCIESVSSSGKLCTVRLYVDANYKGHYHTLSPGDAV
jgi:hypothetical protein